MISEVWLVAVTPSTTATCFFSPPKIWQCTFYIDYLNIAIACFKYWLNPNLAGIGLEGVGSMCLFD